jgi:hypothetical protein
MTGVKQPVESTHSARVLPDPSGWVLYMSHRQPRRLVVFVHGFRGEAVPSWQHFPDGGLVDPWWRESDLLFVGYPSTRDNITGTAARVRTMLPRFYPKLPDELLQMHDARFRSASDRPYEELLIVGHSLGGVIVRRALCDIACEWLDQLEGEPNAPRPPLLDAQTRLFSPASKGFRPGGWLAFIRHGPAWSLIQMFLSRASAFTDLQPGSDVLSGTERRTKELLSGARKGELGALRARILWAQPDDVVLPERYDTDYVDRYVDGKDHSSVCKPRDSSYIAPWTFVETGSPE